MQIEARLSDADKQDIAERVAAILLPQLAAHAAPETPDQLKSEPLTASLLGVQPHCLRDARKRGEIEFIRVGRSVKYSREQIAEYKRRQTNGEVAR